MRLREMARSGPLQRSLAAEASKALTPTDRGMAARLRCRNRLATDPDRWIQLCSPSAFQGL